VPGIRLAPPLLSRPPETLGDGEQAGRADPSRTALRASCADAVGSQCPAA
jgi:hypothetical protein